MFLTSLLPSFFSLSGEFNWFDILKTVLFLSALFFAAGTILRVIFGKDSKTCRALSACLSIVMLYLAAILLYLFLPDIRSELASLPFVTVDHHRFVLWNLSELPDTILYSALIRLALLAFLVNFLEAVMPRGKAFFSWYFWKCATILLSLVLYRLCCSLADLYIPELFTTWAKPVILIFWSTILFSGIIKLLLSVVLTVMNPIIGALYTFFFSNLLGRQCSKSLLTTAVLVVLIVVLNHLGFAQFAFSDFSPASYLPVCAILIGTLYSFGRFL